MLNPNSLINFKNLTPNPKINTITERSNLNNRLQKAGNFIIGNEKNLKRPTNNLEPKTSSRFLSQTRELNPSTENTNSNKFIKMNNFNFNSNKSQRNNKETYINKIPINLEDLLIQEEHLWMILTYIRCGGDFSHYSEEFIEFSHLSSIQSFEIYFNEIKFKKDLRIYSSNEYISVMISLFTLLTNKISDNSLTHLKNLFYYIHQNILLIISLIIGKINKEYIFNIWGNKLKEIIFNRLSPEMKQQRGNLDDEYFHINQNNSIITNMLKNYIEIYFKTQNAFDNLIFNFVNMIILNYQKYPIDIYYIKSNLSKLKIDLLNSIMFKQAMSTYEIKPPIPFLPPLNKDKYTYSLVLDLDETLVHSIAETGKTLIRPGTNIFLKELSPLFEIVIFTAGMQDYADNLLNQMDKERNLIQYRLYRQHTSLENGSNVKDIEKLGRDLSKVIIIDNISENFSKQSDNGIFITPWMGDPNDTELYELIPILKEISVKKVKDVRVILRRFRDKIIQLHIQGDINPLATLKNMIK